MHSLTGRLIARHKHLVRQSVAKGTCEELPASPERLVPTNQQPSNTQLETPNTSLARPKLSLNHPASRPLCIPRAARLRKLRSSQIKCQKGSQRAPHPGACHRHFPFTPADCPLIQQLQQGRLDALKGGVVALVHQRSFPGCRGGGLSAGGGGSGGGQGGRGPKGRD